MGKKHEKRYLINILIGFILTTTGIFTIIYLVFTDDPKFDWLFWGIIATIIINTGLLFLGRALIHKVKADLIRRQKHKAKTDTAMMEQE